MSRPWRARPTVIPWPGYLAEVQRTVGCLAAPVHRAHRTGRRQNDRRWGPDRPPVHRLACETPQAPRRRHLPRARTATRRSATSTTSLPGATAAQPPTPTAAGDQPPSATARGPCPRPHHTRELPGWRIEVPRLDRHGQPYLIATPRR